MKNRAGLIILTVFLVFAVLFVMWVRQFDWNNFEQLSDNNPDYDSAQELDEATESAKHFQSVVIIDGDTIDVNGQRIRYIGINTPELGSGKEASDCFAKEAADFNRNLTIKGELKLEKDVSETDKYGRLLRYVYLQDGRMVNEVLVKEGYARAATYPPDVKYAEKFRQLEKEAKLSGKGLWSKCNSV
ncbi:thermonuclease family protein [Candidatus Curtissbacteria bacterium]|nr:thermonuclease family protein [Candidatus Curtissbacteria bacterium]